MRLLSNFVIRIRKQRNDIFLDLAFDELTLELVFLIDLVEIHDRIDLDHLSGQKFHWFTCLRFNFNNSIGDGELFFEIR